MIPEYVPPTSRREAIDEVLRSGFTTSAIVAIAMAWPLPGEIDEALHSRLGQLMLTDYGEGACWYLHAWGRGSCRWPRQ